MASKLSYEELQQRVKELEKEVLESRQAQEAFHGNALRYQALLDDAPVGIWHAAPDGAGGYVNPKLAELTGLTQETAQRDGWATALHPDDRERVFKEWRDFVEGKAPYHSTYRFVPSEGEVRWVIGQAMPVHAVDGGLSGYIGTLTDITDRKRAEEALREERRFSENLLGSSPAFFVAVSPDGQTLTMNGTMLRSLGYEKEEVLGTNYLETFVPEDEGGLLLNLFNNLADLNEVVLNERHLLTKDGRELLVEWHTRPMLKENGELDYFFSVGIDITERKQSEEELRESEERFRAVFEGSLDAILLADPESGDVIDANPAAEELLSRPVEEIIGLHQTQLHPAHLKSSVEEAFSKHAREEDTERPFESSVIRSDGREVPVEILAHIIQINGVPVLHGTFRDITERKRIEEALLESEQRYRLLAESMSDIIWTSDMDLRFSYVSPSIERFVGYAPEELIGKTVIEHLTPSSIEVATQAFLEEFAGEHTKASDSHGSRTMELQRLHKDGSVVWGELTFTILRDAKGRLAGILGVTRDITERKRAEMALQEAEEEWRSLTENSPDRIMKLDPEGGILFMNRPIHLTRGQVLGTSVLEYLTESSKPIMKACLKRVLETGEHGYCEVEHLYPDGKTRDFEVRVGPVTHSGQIVALAANATDITDRKRLEEEVMKVARLESLGILAGGIAHDFNNILTPILSNISMARIYGELDSEIDEMLTDAEKATLRAKSLTQQLLTFSKGGAPIKGVCSISKLLRDSSRFALSGSHVRCEHSLSEDLWAVEMDEGQVGQVIHNLVINADQASPSGGTIKIGAENVVIGNKDSLPLQEGKYVRISISDSGIGIPEKHLSNIFDPFYTTKVKGSGLGLATSFTIIKQHEGTIQVESELGVGSTFHIYLPASQEALAGEEKGWQKATTGQGRILVVDDEQPVRASVGTILKRLGYEVEFAEDGREGIAVYEKAMKEERAFDVIIMDLTIPGGLGGQEAAEKLKRIDPGAKVIVSSGYSDDRVLADFQNFGFSDVLVKPYKADDLAKVINNVLNAGKG